MYIFRQINDAIFNFHKYPELVKTSGFKVFLYAIFLIICSAFTYIIAPSIVSYNKLGGYDYFITENLPDFKVKDNKVLVDEYIKKNIGDEFTIIFDVSDVSSITTSDFDEANPIILKVTPSYISSNLLGYSVNIETLIEMFGISEKNDLMQFKTFFTALYLISFFIIILYYSFSIFVLFLISALFINMISSFYKIKMKFRDVLKLAIYIETTPFILQMIFMWFSMLNPLFNMTLPSIVYTGTTFAYAHFVFKHFQDNNLYKLSSTVVESE